MMFQLLDLSCYSFNFGLVGVLWTTFASLSLALNVVNRQHFSLEEQEWTTNDYEIVRVDVTNSMQSVNSTFTDAGHARNIIVTIYATTAVFVLDLELNGYLFAKSYTELAIGNDTVQNIKVDHITDHCYYTGKVRGFSESTSAIRTCRGISGYFSIKDVTYHIVPMSNALSSYHKMFSTTDDIFQFNCGLDKSDYHKRPFANFSNTRFKRSFQWPQDLDKKTKVVELYVVNDFSQYQAKGSDVTTVNTRTKTIVNIISSIYQPLDIYVVLVGTEVWTQSNKIGVSANSSTTLDNFLKYRVSSITTKNDDAFLITTQSFYNGVVGKAPVGTMCSFRLSGGIAADLARNPPIVVAATMAHEIGHNFGLVHDTDACQCDDPNHSNCIMYPSSSSSNPSTTWSQCSKDQFVVSFQHGMDICLYNKPPTVFDPSSVCGNGLLESGEQCDCGKAPASECNSRCCNATTCQLSPNAACSAGRCCDVSSCQLKGLSVPCRPKQTDCDLPEYCSGTDANCPADSFKQDGTNCSTIYGAAAYCSQGKCENHQSQCKLLYGTQADSGDTVCYGAFNTPGTANGNCGIVWGQTPSYLPCNPSDIMCGKLQCNQNAQNLAYITDYYLLSWGSYGSSECNSVIFDVTDIGIQDPGLVPNGAMCGDGKMCLKQKCVSIQSLNEPSCPNSCSQHGVCNSLGLCHCDDGFGPPDCSGSGSGGSINSNPAGRAGTGRIPIFTTPTTKARIPLTTVPTTTMRPQLFPTMPSVTKSTVPTTQGRILLSTIRPTTARIQLSSVTPGYAGVTNNSPFSRQEIMPTRSAVTFASSEINKSAAVNIGLIVGLCIGFIIIVPLIIICIVCGHKHRKHVGELYHSALLKCKTSKPGSHQNNNTDGYTPNQPPVLNFYKTETASYEMPAALPENLIATISYEELTPNRPAPPVPHFKKLPPLPTNAKPVPSIAENVTTSARPVTTKVQPVPIKTQSVPAKIQPVPIKTQPVPTQPKPVPTKALVPPVQNNVRTISSSFQKEVPSVSKSVASWQIPKPPANPVSKRVGYNNFGASCAQRPVSSFPPVCKPTVTEKSQTPAVIDISDSGVLTVQQRIAQFGTHSGAHIVLRADSDLGDPKISKRPLVKAKPTRKESFSNV